MNPLIAEFKKHGNLSIELEEALSKKIIRSVKKKNDHFLKKGQVISSLFVLESGCVRAYFIKDLKEINSWFGVEGEVLGSILPIFVSKPSTEYIQFLEDSVIYSISVKDMNEFYENYPELNFIGRKLAEDYCMILEERIASLQTDPAEQRYQTLINK